MLPLVTHIGLTSNTLYPLGDKRFETNGCLKRGKTNLGFLIVPNSTSAHFFKQSNLKQEKSLWYGRMNSEKNPDINGILMIFDCMVFESLHPISFLQGVDFLEPFLPIEVPKYGNAELQSVMDYYIDRRWIQAPEGTYQNCRNMHLLVKGQYMLLIKKENGY